MNFIYLIECSGYYKIGMARDVARRIRQLSMPFDVRLVHSFPAEGARIAEEYLHGVFAAKRVRGEWFALDASDVAQICALRDFEGCCALYKREQERIIAAGLR